MEGFLFVIAVLSFASIWACKAGYKLGVPVLLMFLVMGMLFGDEGLRLVKFDSFENASTIGTVALCVILFSGGMDTKLSDIKPVIREGLLLATLGVFLMAVITGFVIRFVFDMMYINFWNFVVLVSLFTDLINKNVKISEPGDILIDDVIDPLPPSPILMEF